MESAPARQRSGGSGLYDFIIKDRSHGLFVQIIEMEIGTEPVVVFRS